MENVAVVWLDGKLASLSVVRPLDTAIPFKFNLFPGSIRVSPTPRQDREAHEALCHLRNAAERGMAK